MMLRFLLMLSLATGVAAAPPPWTRAALDGGLAAYSRGDYRVADAQFKALAAQGSAIAETMLGAMHARGQGVAADPASAATWWLRAANRGYPPAQLALAQAFADGAGVRRDLGTAWVWARLAAVHGDTPTAVRAAALARQLGAGMDASTRLRLDRRRLAWRPWATLPE